MVAVVLTASGLDQRGSTVVRTPPPPTWEQSLSSLVGPGGASARSDGAAIAIEITVAAAPGRPTRRGMPVEPTLKVVARLVTPGRNGWVAGGLSWTKLANPYQCTEYRTSHVRLLRELHAVYRSHENSYSYGYHAEQKTIDLATFESRQLWTLLDEAEAIGVAMVHGRKKVGPLASYTRARVLLDVTRAAESDSLSIAPVLRIEGPEADAAPLTFIGSDGHGVVYVDRAQIRAGTDHGDWRLRLARLDGTVPAQLQRMAVDNQHLVVPAGQGDRFRNEFYPRLRHIAPVVSTDGSFTPPAISDPTLVLRANYGANHALDLNWEWAYQIGDSPLRIPLGQAGSDDGYRDLAKERSVLADLGLPLEEFGLRDEEHALAPGARLRGIDTLRFTTEVIPLLTGATGTAVEVGGDPVDYREAGDTLRIGVSTGEVAGETDWFDLGVTITVEGRQVPFAEVFKALDADESHLLMPDGAYFSLHKPELQALRKLIEEARALRDSPDGPLKISRFQVGLWDELAELGVVEKQAAAWQRQLDALRSVDSVDAIQPPDTLAAQLRGYQLDGYRWLRFLWDFQLGGVLADDMGLGKTVQTLALICHAKQADPDRAPFLVVAPTSVVSNWAAEIARFAPGLTVVCITDTMRKRGQTLAETVAGADVVVTSYTLFRIDYDNYAESTWSGLILDEAQFTKNHQSKIYQCARRLPAPFKLAITGTPMENNLMELWSLLSITSPGLFPNPTRFRDYYGQPIEKRGDTELLAQLRRRIKPLVRRRTKEQVAADLPAKQEQVLEVELHPKHRKIYQTHLQRERRKVLGLVDDMNKNRFTILSSLTLLRQLSLHPGLVDDGSHDLASAKIDVLLEHLHEVVDGGHRALVFSQFTGFLDKVRGGLDAAGIDYCYLDGKTRDRATVLKRFKDGSAPVFLISLKAGGFGLNLTEADYCFLLDPWWNPATEAQAVDRTHRIGQTRNVMVYRLIAKDTIEEKVMALKARKAELFTSVMDDGNMFGSGLDVADIRELFA
ncbi:probable helicase [Alloactinosynnema sp. L-07]|nr:probable helicase [Alloactinosynnema sp. L-07]